MSVSKVKLITEHPSNTVHKCNVGSSLETDWCQAKAAKESLREHMQMLKIAHEKIADLYRQKSSEIVIGDRRIYKHDGEIYAEGTMLTSGKWDELMNESGLVDKWCQIIIRQVESQDNTHPRLTGQEK